VRRRQQSDNHVKDRARESDAPQRDRVQGQTKALCCVKENLPTYAREKNGGHAVQQGREKGNER